MRRSDDSHHPVQGFDGTRSVFVLFPQTGHEAGRPVGLEAGRPGGSCNTGTDRRRVPGLLGAHGKESIAYNTFESRLSLHPFRPFPPFRSFQSGRQALRTAVVRLLLVHIALQSTDPNEPEGQELEGPELEGRTGRTGPTGPTGRKEWTGPTEQKERRGSEGHTGS